MVSFMLSASSGIANCIPSQDADGSLANHVNSTVQLIQPLPFSDQGFVVRFQDSNWTIITQDFGDSWHEFSGVRDIYHKPGSDIVTLSYDNRISMIYGSITSHVGSAKYPFNWLMASQGGELSDVSGVEVNDYSVLFLHGSGESAIVQLSPDFSKRTWTIQLDKVASCKYNLHTPQIGSWCISDQNQLVYAESNERRVILDGEVSSVYETENYVLALADKSLWILNSPRARSAPLTSDFTAADNQWVKPQLPPTVSDVHFITEASERSSQVSIQDSSEFRESQFIVEYTTTDGSKHTGLWHSTEDGTSFMQAIELKDTSSIWRVSQVSYSLDSAEKLHYSPVNGHTWFDSKANLDFTKGYISSQGISAVFKNDEILSMSYDGINWQELPLPSTGSKGKFQMALADFGSILVIANDGMFWAWFGEWVELNAVNKEIESRNIHDGDDYSNVFIIGTKIYFNGTQDYVDLADALNSPLCGFDQKEIVGQSECVMGQKRIIERRLGKARCLMGSQEMQTAKYETCACSIEDFVCMDNAVNQDRCDPEHLQKVIGDKCTSDEVSIMGPSDSQAAGMPDNLPDLSSDAITPLLTWFHDSVKDYLYLPGTTLSPEDETLLVWTTKGDMFVSQDQGTNWVTVPEVTDVINVFKSKTDANQVYAFSSSSLSDNKVYVSWDRGHSFESLQLPAKPSLMFSIIPDVVTFHPEHPEWMLFTGAVDCDSTFDCPYTAFVSKNKGKTWNKIHEDVLQCRWVHGLHTTTHEDFTYCFIRDEQQDDGTMKTVWSNDYFASGEKLLAGIDRVTHVVVDKKFVIAGYVDSFGEMQAALSRDGINFESLKYPPNVKREPDSGLVIIRTDDETVTLYEGVNAQRSESFGSIIRSGGYGTHFVSILDNVNRASGLYDSYVDIDRFLSVEGVLVANVVENADDVLKKGANKKLITYISHSNGAKWDRIPAPDTLCQGEKDCFLNLHGHSERSDSRNTPSSPTAVGMFFGRGNVGPSLDDLKNSQTFMTRDAGMSWKKVSDRPMFWEFGDSGSILILIDSSEPTNKISYSVDEGDTWNDFVFSDTFIKVVNLATIPSDTSQKFVIFGQPPMASEYGSVAIQINFQDMVTQKCQDSDFVWWTPAHPQLGSQCSLGHKTSYLRRIPSSNCYIGKAWSGNKPSTVQKKISDCECTRDDYECDYGYVLDVNTNTCKLIDGITLPDQAFQCSGNAIAWHEITGYRKLSASTCKNGQQLDKPQFYACPGKEKEFKEQFPDGKAPSVPPSEGGDLSREARHSLVVKFIRAIFKFIMVLIFLGTSGVALYSVHRHFESRGVSLISWSHSFFGDRASSIHLPEPSNFNSESVHKAASVIKSSLKAIVPAIQYGISKSPFIGSSHPYDHSGFYSRMDDEERMRILESDDGFEEEDSDLDIDRSDVNNNSENNTYMEHHGVYNDEDDPSNDSNDEFSLGQSHEEP